MLLDKQSDTNLPDTKQFDEHVSRWAKSSQPTHTKNQKDEPRY